MADYDGTSGFTGGVVTGNKLDTTVLWHGTSLPSGAANKVPQYGVFRLFDSISAPTTYNDYIQTSATMSSPVFTLIPKPSSDPLSIVAAHSTTIGDYTIPSSATASSSVLPGNSFDEYYTTNAGWTAVGTNVTVDSGVTDAAAAVTATCNADNRVWKSLGVTLSDTLWIMESDIILSSSAGNDNMPYSLCAGSGQPDTATQDLIGVYWNTSSGKMNIVYKDGAGSLANGTGTLITVSQSTQYYIRVQRTSSTNVDLAVFSDAARTSHITGSPQSFTIPSTITGLTHLHHGTRSVANAATTTFTIDNTAINSNSSTIGIGYPVTNIWDNDTVKRWTSNSETNPYVYIDAGSSKNICEVAWYHDTTNTTETEVKIQTSTDASTWTDVRKITLSNLTNNAWNYIRFNVSLARYVRFYGTGTSKVLSIWELKYLSKTDSELILEHGHKTISNSDTTIPLSG